MKKLLLTLALLAVHSAALAQSTVDFNKRPEPAAPAESKVFGKGYDGKEVTVTGFVQDEPRYYTGEGGKYQSWTFKLNASAQRVHGDEYLMVTFHTVKWGRTVGTFNLKKGEQVTLSGIFHEFKGGVKPSGGILGSLGVNDKSIKEVLGN